MENKPSSNKYIPPHKRQLLAQSAVPGLRPKIEFSYFKSVLDSIINPVKDVIEYPFGLEWIIAEERLKDLKNSPGNKYLDSEKFTAIQSSGAQYFLRIYPCGRNSAGKTQIFLHLKLGNEKNNKAEFKFSIKSSNWNHEETCFLEDKTFIFGCTIDDEIFDLSKKFIVDGKFSLKFKGTLKIKKSNSDLEILNNFKTNVLVFL
uniref:MATH domain-containing protein n=1 Tax=Panagrolaimus davidi TaxID=227884 RepID=A0A914PJB9_9BILA